MTDLQAPFDTDFLSLALGFNAELRGKCVKAKKRVKRKLDHGGGSFV